MNTASVILCRLLALIIFNTCAALYLVLLFSVPGWIFSDAVACANPDAVQAS
jgi:hypothetical protein